MTDPCKASEAGRDSDEDLQSDTETLQCMRELRLNIYRWQAWHKAIQ
jgi:hypothetical protein